MGTQLIREQLFEILHNRKRMPGERFSDIEGKIENLVNQEVEKRIAERQLTDEDIINAALTYVNHKSLKPANRGLIKDALIIGMKAYRSRLGQKTEGGGE